MSEPIAFVDEFFTESSELPSGLHRTHRVDVVLVTHDGARWLPRTLAAIRGSRVQPDAVHVIDTESIDSTLEHVRNAGELITTLQSAPRTQAYGASVAQAVSMLPEADAELAWIWLLHDDSAPAADGLETLLRAAEAHPDAAILGMKSVGWNDSSRLQEVGITMTGAGHRDPRIERGERDQGQYTETEEVLAVGSAGMLIRRDAWQTLQGMREIFAFYRDDIDFCWRAWEHGYRVRVVPQAEIAHREAASHAVRAQDVRHGTAHKLGRLNALGMTYIHARAVTRPFVLLRLSIASLFRALVYFVGKDPRDGQQHRRKQGGEGDGIEEQGAGRDGDTEHAQRRGAGVVGTARGILCDRGEVRPEEHGAGGGDVTGVRPVVPVPGTLFPTRSHGGERKGHACPKGDNWRMSMFGDPLLRTDVR